MAALSTWQAIRVANLQGRGGWRSPGISTDLQTKVIGSLGGNVSFRRWYLEHNTAVNSLPYQTLPFLDFSPNISRYSPTHSWQPFSASVSGLQGCRCKHITQADYWDPSRSGFHPVEGIATSLVAHNDGLHWPIDSQTLGGHLKHVVHIEATSKFSKKYLYPWKHGVRMEARGQRNWPNIFLAWVPMKFFYVFVKGKWEKLSSCTIHLK